MRSVAEKYWSVTENETKTKIRKVCCDILSHSIIVKSNNGVVCVFVPDFERS